MNKTCSYFFFILQPFYRYNIEDNIAESSNDGNDSDEDRSSEDEEMDFDFSNENDEDNAPQPSSAFEKLLNANDANVTIQANFIVNKIEILFAILKYCTVYNLPNSAVADLCKMLNSFLDVPIIKDTRYHLDKLFYNGEGICYHAVCPECGIYLGKFNKQKNRTIFCNVCEKDINLKDPWYRDFFVTLDITHEIQNLIENNSDYYNSIISERNQEIIKNNFSDIHDGLKYKNFILSLPDDQKQSYLTLTFNSDGSPIFKSSSYSIWPIQMIPNELPLHVRYQKPITYALWFGKNKPNMTYFLSPFVESLNEYSTNGIACIVNGETKYLKLYSICCCVDSVARAPMQGFVQFNGYYGCNWCLHPGKSVMHNKKAVVKYPLLYENPPRRTQECTLEHVRQAIASNLRSVFGVKKVSPLLSLNGFDIIDGFVPDFMHCIALGVAKQFADYWFNSTNQPYSISKENRRRIDRHIKSFKVPNQLVRLSRSIEDRKFWKSKEWENWVLYYSLPTLAEIPNFQNYLSHWALLVEAFHILLKKCITFLELERADQLLKRFVALTQFYYSEDAMTFNIHQLLHLPQSVADWGPLWSHCGYPFESGNGQIVRKVHAAKGVLNQICRNLSVNRCLVLLEKRIVVKENSTVKDFCYYLDNRCTDKTERFGSNRYFIKDLRPIHKFAQELNMRIDHIRAYKKLVKCNNVFKSCKKDCLRSDNSFARTKDGTYIRIVQFIIDEVNEKEYTIYRKVEIENTFSDDCTAIHKVNNIIEDLNILETENIEDLCVYMTVNRKKYISALPNMYWY